MNKLFTLTILGFAALLIPFTMNGQGVVNTAKITVNSGTVMTITNGGFTNNSGGGVTNNGEMQVDGDWTNNDTQEVFGTAPTAGLVTLNGGAQTIGGTNTTNFYNLTATGTGDKTLDVDTDVENVATLTGNDMILNTNDLTLESSSTGAITGTGGIVSETAPSAGYGNLVWNIGNNTGNYVVPFKTSGGTDIAFGYDITNAGAGSTANSYKSFATYPTNNENTWTGATWTDLPTDVTHLTDDYQQASHYWVMDRFWIIDNDATGNYTTYPQIEYDFLYDFATDAAGSNIITEANLMAQRFNDNNNTWLDWLYSPNASGGSVTVNLANQQDYFKVWTLVDDSDPLPIELAKFEGQCYDGEVKVTWTTWTESRNDFFTLERSGDGEHFEMVDVIDGAGNSNQAITYTIDDVSAYGGTSYYRLKDTDVRGNENYSEVIAVTCESSGNTFDLLNAYQNGNGRLVIDFTAGENEPYNVTLMDPTGRIIIAESNNAYEGYNQVLLPVLDLARGAYIVKLSNDKTQFGRRVMLN